MYMKLAILMYLKDDENCVDKLLKQIDIQSFSRLPVEGRRPGPAGGWYGETAPYQAELLISILPEDQAARLTEAVATCTGVEDPRHPIRVATLDVDQFVCCDHFNKEEQKP
jgi:hypothetical protein